MFGKLIISVHVTSKINYIKQYKKYIKNNENIAREYLYSLALNLFGSFRASPIFNYLLYKPIDYKNVISASVKFFYEKITSITYAHSKVCIPNKKSLRYILIYITI